jgi:hypothetical protein
MNNSSNTRGMNSLNSTRNTRASGPRPVGMRAAEDDHSNSFPRNGSYRNLDVRPGDRSGDNLQFGMTRRPNAFNDPRRPNASNDPRRPNASNDPRRQV